ncbi:MAG TPA: phosphosulfolactate synthase [Galbitalea sp.]|jgi:phosphosulfolactate synthase|nr:phosphosulfolactate synthase [Galbitalea sp.]
MNAPTTTAADTILNVTLGLPTAPRTTKPRKLGQTMVMDQGWPISFVSDVLDDFGDQLDIVKLWDPFLRVTTSQVEKRIEVYRAHDVIVQPGGIWIEMAERHTDTLSILPTLRDMGFNALEISNTTSTHDGLKRREDLVAAAVEHGFKVFGEVGKKFFDGDETRLTDDNIDTETTIREFHSLIEAGAWRVYWEGHLLRKVLGDDPESIKAHAFTGVRQVREVVEEIGLENIIFEASGLRPRANRQWLQFWLIRLFGPEVNIGNARIEELGNLEALRMGTHPIFDLGSAGNYSGI